MSIEGVAPIAQSTPHTSFIEPSDPVVLADLSGRRHLVRQRVLGSGTSTTPPDTPVARRRPTPIVYSPPSRDIGRLVIDESSSTAGTSTNATVVVPGTTHDYLDISWLDEQQTRLQPPPPGSGQ